MGLTHPPNPLPTRSNVHSMCLHVCVYTGLRGTIRESLRKYMYVDSAGDEAAIFHRYYILYR